MSTLTEFEKLLQSYQPIEKPNALAELIQSYTNADNQQARTAATTAPQNKAAVSGEDVLKFIPPTALAGVVGGDDAGILGASSVVAGATPPVKTDALDALNLYTKQFGGKDYSLDTATVDKLTQQILSQNLTSKWSGQGFGSAEANARGMAENLYASGVKDIKDVGLVDTKVDAVITPKYEYVYQGGIDEYGTPIPTAKIIGYVDQYGNPVDASLAREEVLYSSGDSSTSENVYYAPIGTRKIIGNKATGQSLLNDYGERGGVDNAWSGTFAGKGNTAYRVHFDDKGNPYFYTTGHSSNDLVNLLGNDPILNAIAQIGASYFGGPAGSAALNAAMGKDLKDVAKSYILSQLGQEAFKGLTDTGIDTNLFGETGANFAKDIQDIFGKTGADIIGKTAGQYVAGEGKVNIENLLINQGVGVATNAVLGEIPGFDSLNATEKKFVTNIVSSTLNDGKLSANEAISAAFSAATQAMKTTSQAPKVADAGTDADGEFQLPGGTQVAGPYKIDVAGVPLFQESVPKGFTPPPGLRLLSVADDIKEVYDSEGKFLKETKPMGSYIDYSLLPGKGVWVVKDDFVQKFDANNFADDIAMFYQNQGDLDKIAQGTPSTFDDELADLLKYKGIKNTGDLNASKLTNDDLFAMFNSNFGDSFNDKTVKGNNIDSLDITGKRIPGTIGSLDTVSKPEDDIPEIAITASRPIGTIGTLDTVPTPTNVATTTPPVTTPVTTPKVTPTKVTPKTETKTTKKTTDTDAPASEAKNAPSQDPYANIKLMEELFGGDLAYKLRALGAPKNLASADIDALARLLRG